jgi:hypothetical protein
MQNIYCYNVMYYVGSITSPQIWREKKEGQHAKHLQMVSKHHTKEGYVTLLFNNCYFHKHSIHMCIIDISSS